MKILKPEAYDHMERLAFARLPPAVVERHQPVAFNAVSYPHRVDRLEELGRYVDAMQSGTDRIIASLGGALTTEEREEADALADMAAAVSKHVTGTAVRPGDALLQAFVPLRAIKRIYGEATALIHELGPGSGYLSVLLSRYYTVRQIEISQGFHLWQAALASAYPERMAPPRPWWFHVDHLDDEPDLIVANHMLSEMHLAALEHLADNARCPIIADNLGSQAVRQHSATRMAFLQRGWQIVELERKPQLNLEVLFMLPPRRP